MPGEHAIRHMESTPALQGVPKSPCFYRFRCAVRQSNLRCAVDRDRDRIVYAAFDPLPSALNLTVNAHVARLGIVQPFAGNGSGTIRIAGKKIWNSCLILSLPVPYG